MGLLSPPVLFSLELHVPIEGASRAWTTPRDLAALTPQQRVYIMRCVMGQVDQLATQLGLTLRYEPAPTPAQLRSLLD